MPPNTSNTDLYRNLSGFPHFASGVVDDAYYQRLPEDWIFIVTDIVSSTSAVEAGRYRDVNYVGVACIAALKNALGQYDFPTVFGGDGASAAVHEKHRATVEKTLMAVRSWAASQFDLSLRVGIIPVSEISARGAHIDVGKLELAPGNDVAMFRGSGVEIADQLVKSDADDNPFVLDSSADSSPDLQTLSCRWSPLKPSQDIMLCVLVGAHADQTESDSDLSQIYRDVIRMIDDIIRIDSASPVKLNSLKFRVKLANIVREIKSEKGHYTVRLLRVLGINAVALFSFVTRMTLGGFNPEEYKERLTVNSDYKRLNGTLQLVLDCTDAQADEVEQLLEQQHAMGLINFGTYRADTAVLTCITPDVVQGIHVHYVDGADCGFWQAAKALKARRNSATADSPPTC